MSHLFTLNTVTRHSRFLLLAKIKKGGNNKFFEVGYEDLNTEKRCLSGMDAALDEKKS